MQGSDGNELSFVTWAKSAVDSSMDGSALPNTARATGVADVPAAVGCGEATC